MNRALKVLTACSALAVGHILYQMLQAEPNYFVAWERVWFQANAIIVYEILWGTS